jgi:hypothetical protein
MRNNLLILTTFMVGSGFAQTRLDLKNQAANVDFTQAITTAPVKTGSVLPGTCTVGELFFLSTAAPGANLYACTAPDTFSLETGGSGGGGGGGATSLGGLTDLRVTLSGSTYTIAAGAARYGNVTTAFTPATLEVVSGTDSGTLRFYVDYNAGSPRLACAIPTLFTGTYNPTGMVCGSGNTFPENALPLATATLTSGSPGGPADVRAIQQAGPIPVAGNGLLGIQNGQSITLQTDASAVVMKFTGTGTPGSIAASTLGDLYIDSSAQTVYTCMNIAGGCNGVTSGEWVALN